MFNVCLRQGMRQVVREPTRGSHLLDLVISDLDTVLAARVLPHIADHRAVLVDVEFSLPTAPAHSRELWDFAQADWQALCRELAGCDWAWMEFESPDECANRLTSIALQVARKHILRRHAECFRPRTPG